MTPHQVIGVSVRLFSIWLVLFSLQTVTTAFALDLRPNSGDTVSMYLFAGLYVIAAIILWWFPMTVAQRLLPRTKYDDVLRIPAQQVTVSATVVLGLWVLATRAIPAISYYVTLAAYWSRSGQTVSSLPLAQHAAFAVGIVELVVALALMFKAPDISVFILKKHKDSETE